MRLLISMLLVLLNTVVIGQGADSSSFRKGWSISAEIGLNSNRHRSSFASTSPNYSLGIIKSFPNDKKFEHGIHAKFAVFNEILKDVPYSFINSSGQFVTESVKQKTTYPLIYLGWRLKSKLNDRFFVYSSIGFNYKLPSTYSTTTSEGENKSELPATGKNFFFSNPEIALGFGTQFHVGELLVNLIPKYRLNIGTKSAASDNGIGNSLYMVHSLGVEVNVGF